VTQTQIGIAVHIFLFTILSSILQRNLEMNQKYNLKKHCINMFSYHNEHYITKQQQKHKHSTHSSVHKNTVQFYVQHPRNKHWHFNRTHHMWHRKKYSQSTLHIICLALTLCFFNMFQR